jgi:hypothetical protein
LRGQWLLNPLDIGSGNASFLIDLCHWYVVMGWDCILWQSWCHHYWFDTLWLETQSFWYHAIHCDFALAIQRKRSEGQHTHQSTMLHCSRHGDYEEMERNWQDLHDDDKTCMQSSYWELILENGQ